MPEIADLSVVIGANITDLQAKTRTANKEITGFRDKATNAMNTVKNAALPIAGVLGGIGVASLNVAVDFEADFADVIKTVDGTSEELDGLRDSLRDMATVGDLSALENAHETLTNIAAIAGQLGVPTSEIEEFTRVVGGMTVATDLSAESAATFAARFSNVTGMPITEIGNLADAIVTLGNNSAAQESEITAVANRLASLAGMNFEVDEILGLSAAIASLGLNPELGSTNVIKTITDMTNAAAAGGPKLTAFADAVGMLPGDFAELQNSDPAAAFDALLAALSEMDASTALSTLQDLGITSSEQQRTILTLAQGYDTVTASMNTANTAFAGNGALMEEVGKKADTTAGKMETFKNNTRDLGISLGQFLLPAANAVSGALTDIFQGLNNGDEVQASQGLLDLLQWAVDFTGVDIGQGLVSWITAIQNFETIVTTIVDDIRRRFEMLRIDLELAAAQATVTLQQSVPEPLRDNDAMANAQDAMATLGAERNAFEIVDRLNKAIRDEMKGNGFSLSDMIQLNDDGYALPAEQLFGSILDNPDAISEQLRNTLADAMQSAIAGGDAEEIQGLLQFSDVMNLDPESIKADLQAAIGEAFVSGDEEGLSALLQADFALAVGLDMSFLDDLQAQIEAQTISATVKANINVEANVGGRTVDSVVSGGAASISGQRSVPMFHDGGVFRSPTGEGLAMLRDGERVLTPEETRSYSKGGGVTINYSSFGETPYNALQKIKRASADAGY